MINVKKIKPMFNALVTTMNKYDEDIVVGGIIDTNKEKGAIKEFQTILAVGDSVRPCLEVGQIVSINPSRYGFKKHQEGSLKDNVVTDNPVIGYKFNVITLDGVECLLLYDNDINYILEEYEEVPDQPANNIIMPEKKKLIV